MKSKFLQGLIDGIPIALGYIAVSFGFAISAVKLGISVLATIGISATNLTSAGQMAGVTIIAAGGTLVELALTQFIINLRYSLMGIALTQKLDKSFTFLPRLICAFGITDEVFAVASTKKEKVTPQYMYGLILLPFIGWTLGTTLGALAGEVLPASLTNAMGIAIYGMFIAIVVPVAREKLSVLIASLIAIASAILFKFVLTSIGEGFAIIISAIIAATCAALLFPISEEEEDEE